MFSATSLHKSLETFSRTAVDFFNSLSFGPMMLKTTSLVNLSLLGSWMMMAGMKVSDDLWLCSDVTDFNPNHRAAP